MYFVQIYSQYNNSDTQEFEMQEKFNAIIHQYFEPVQTKEGSVTNLFYYKPPFIRNNHNTPRQENMSQDDRISFIVDLVAHARAPLMIRLNATYKTTVVNKETDGVSCTEIVVPITSLPTSYTGCTADGKEFNLEDEKRIYNDRFPLMAGSTTVSLQIVCLNMPRSDLDDHSFTDNLFSYNPE